MQLKQGLCQTQISILVSGLNVDILCFVAPIAHLSISGSHLSSFSLFYSF